MLFKPSYTTDNNNSRKLNWSLLSGNPNAISILEKNLDKVNLDSLSMNPNPIHFIL